MRQSSSFDRENPAGVIYGLITIGALLAAESGQHETYLETIGSVVLAMLLYWFAHSYSTLLGSRLATQRNLSAALLGRALAHDWQIIQGSLAPLSALFVCWIAQVSQTSAVNIAIWTSVGCLVAFELLAAIRARATTKEVLFETMLSAVMGLAILALRAIVH